MRVKFTIGKRLAGELHFGNGNRAVDDSPGSRPNLTARAQLHATYLAERGALVQGELESARGFDKYLITLASGALALSITFVHTLAPLPKHTLLLCISWASFALSLILMLICFLISQYAYRRQREVLEKWYEDDEPFGNPAATMVDVLNIIALVLFAGGVVLLALFSFKNLS